MRAGALLGTATGVSGGICYDIDGDGQYIAYLYQQSSTYEVRIVERAAPNTVIRTISYAGSAPRRVLFDGRYVVICDDLTVYCYDATDGSSQWTFSHPSSRDIRDIAWSSDRVFVASGTPADAAQVYALNLSTGATVWSYDHDAVVYNIAYGAERVFLSSAAASGHASGATLRALRASNGYDAAGEGGTGTDSTGLAWDAVQSVTQSQDGGQLFCDGALLYLAYDKAGSSGAEVEIRQLTDGAAHVTFAIDQPALRLTVDQRNIYVAAEDTAGTADFYAFCLDKRTGHHVWRYAVDAANNNIRSVYSDGFGVFVGGGSGSTSTFLTLLHRGNTVRTLCHVADLSSGELPYRQALIPQEGT